MSRMPRVSVHFSITLIVPSRKTKIAKPTSPHHCHLNGSTRYTAATRNSPPTARKLIPRLMVASRLWGVCMASSCALAKRPTGRLCHSRGALAQNGRNTLNKVRQMNCAAPHRSGLCHCHAQRQQGSSSIEITFLSIQKQCESGTIGPAFPSHP